MIYDGIYPLLVLIEKLAFFNKRLQRFIISLKNQNHPSTLFLRHLGREHLGQYLNNKNFGRYEV